MTMYAKRELMRDAHRKYRQGCYRSFAEALRHAWLEAKLQNWFAAIRVKEKQTMQKTFDNNNDKDLEKEAQKYLDEGKCETMEDAMNIAWSEWRYEKYCESLDADDGEDYYGEYDEEYGYYG